MAAETLINKFQRAGRSRVDYQGSVIWSVIRFQLDQSQQFDVSWVQSLTNPTQGLALATSGGSFSCAGTKGRKLALWRDTAPAHSIVEATLTRGQSQMRIAIWNVWRQGAGPPVSRSGNSAMRITEGPGLWRLECSDGPGDVDFSAQIVNLQFSGEVPTAVIDW